MVEGNKQVRVDNWGTFFLQRLQVFFAKTDYCDLTLQFDGNVQLKVHRLVMNACTEHFRFLEESCPALEENTILMPSDLQSDVIVPIVNFMYTGMLEFHVSLYEKLYKAAELMNITILTKLLDAQKINLPTKSVRPKQERREITTKHHQQLPVELPSPLPGRKVPVWKRKTAPVSSTPVTTTHYSRSLGFDQKWPATDPLSLDNTPKPTRFEWPEDDLPTTMTLMDNSFEDISYNSRPLLTKEEEEKVKPNFDDLRQNVELPKKSSEKTTSNVVNFKEMEEFAKEQKIRTAMFEDPDEIHEMNPKRKAEYAPGGRAITKKIKISNKENKETTISVESNTPGDIDHTKIVTEILKKYPDLVKKNKNIKLKIMPGNKDSGEKRVVNAVVEPIKRQSVQLNTVSKSKQPVLKQFSSKRKSNVENNTDDEGPWICQKCIMLGGEVQEFVLYYLYRKHMTDVHDEVFDTRLCKYCGHSCSNTNIMMYHLYTKHAIKPAASYNFPKCDRCPYIALSDNKIKKHKLLHDSNEMQCQDCKLAFTSAQSLTGHIRITGHYNKPGRSSYDCQYCMKKIQTAIMLLSHIKKSHFNEGKRDGIVCLDELESLDDSEEMIEDPEDGEEYILSDTLQKDKVKIISNVKVPPTRQDADSTQQQMVEASSEAEALNNVATGIATSLNLVDIVVLDDNQQYILQQDGQNEQEFIIPELTHGQPFTGQVITTQDNAVIQQGMIQSSTGDIASTDELVMVLTDHDYPDEQEGENPENSNIVVLYSHPVEGQEGQFITSQGNLMVNSQTGMLEIRNGSTISTTTASQMVVTNSVDSPIESIEMIQREIDSQGLKQEPFFEEEKKTTIQSEHTKTKPQSMPDIDISESDTQEVPLESESENPVLAEEQENVEQTQEDSEEHNPAQIDEMPSVSSEHHEEKDTSEDNVDGSLDVSTEEPMDIEEIEHKTAETEETEDQETTEEHQPQDTEVLSPKSPTEAEHSIEEDENPQPDEGVDIPPEKIFNELSDEIILNNPSFIGDATEPIPVTEETEENHLEQVQDEQSINQGEPMEVDGKIEEDTLEEKEEDTLEEKEEEEQLREEDVEIGVKEGEILQALDESDNQIVQEEEDEEEGISQDIQQDEPEKSIEDNSSQEINSETVPAKNSADINRTILDDWEDDTDSQQSDKNIDTESQILESGEVNKGSVIPTAVDNVNKLMDDWDEEDEEERKE